MIMYITCIKYKMYYAVNQSLGPLILLAISFGNPFFYSPLLTPQYLPGKYKL